MNLGAPRVGVTRGSSVSLSLFLPNLHGTDNLPCRSALFSFTGSLFDPVHFSLRSPFAAPNSHSTTKIHHSLTFTLLLKNTRATLHHVRSRPRPYSSNPRS